MFHPNHLLYWGRKQDIDIFSYEGVRIDAVLAREGDGDYLYVGFSAEMPEDLARALLAWFGMDRYGRCSKYRFPDRSCYYVQKKSA